MSLKGDLALTELKADPALLVEMAFRLSRLQPKILFAVQNDTPGSQIKRLSDFSDVAGVVKKKGCWTPVTWFPGPNIMPVPWGTEQEAIDALFEWLKNHGFILVEKFNQDDIFGG